MKNWYLDQALIENQTFTLPEKNGFLYVECFPQFFSNAGKKGMNSGNMVG